MTKYSDSFLHLYFNWPSSRFYWTPLLKGIRFLWGLLSFSVRFTITVFSCPGAAGNWPQVNKRWKKTRETALCVFFLSCSIKFGVFSKNMLMCFTNFGCKLSKSVNLNSSCCELTLFRNELHIHLAQFYLWRFYLCL